jgi:cephalosporin-C deacetylase-like acetyl esterase
MRNRVAIRLWCVTLVLMSLAFELAVAQSGTIDSAFDMPRRLRSYFEETSAAKSLPVLTGATWERHRDELRHSLRECCGLEPLPDRVPLDVRMSEPLDHPWCTIHRVSYQLWPGVFAHGLLFMPKELREKPAPAVLCPHGHWQHGNADPTVQSRCLNLARLGYVTFSSTQHHYEDLAVGVSHQTLMVWNNMRALDLLESLPEVDRQRIGVAGESGGGLQTEMLLALDSRVKVAAIVGLTCDFRQIMFPDSTHCFCNHFPAVMQHTDHPEISTLGLPCAVQYLTMNDWTKTFEATNFPTIRELYAAHGIAERVECRYFDTGHDYDRPKREYTYRWFERWLRGSTETGPLAEPETEVFPIETLEALQVDRPDDKGFAEISRLYRAAHYAQPAEVATGDQWNTQRVAAQQQLSSLLGMQCVLPRRGKLEKGSTETLGSARIERVGIPSEGTLVVPTWIVRPAADEPSKFPVQIILDARGATGMLADSSPDAPVRLASEKQMIVLPELRTFDSAFSTGTDNNTSQANAWERNGIVWGRPVAGMAVTDLRAVLDALADRADVDMQHVTIVTRGSGDLAAVALFAAVLDPRLREVELDFSGACYEKRNLLLVPRILLHGDIPYWASWLADRRLSLRNVPPEAGSWQPVTAAFELHHATEQLSL